MPYSKSTRVIGRILLLLLLASLGSQVGRAAGEKDVYKRLFPDQDKLTTLKGFVTVHKYGEKLFLEMPETMVGREFLLSSVIDTSSELTLVGTAAAPQQFFAIGKTDSLVLFLQPRAAMRLDESNEDLTRALTTSSEQATLAAFPIKGYGADSTSFIFDISTFLAPDSKNCFDLEGQPYGGTFSFIRSTSVERGNSYWRDVELFPTSLALYSTVTAKLTTSMLSIQSQELPSHTFECTHYLTLLEKDKMESRVSHPEVGVLTLPFLDYSDPSDIRKRRMVEKVDFTGDEPLTFYVDTLLPRAWQQVAFATVEQWNDVFQELGMQRPLTVVSYPRNGGFDAKNPSYCTISYNRNPYQGMKCFSIVDPRTGEILSSKISMGDGVHDAIRDAGMQRISAVDDRFRTYFIEEEPIMEGLKNYMLKNIGRALGLATNLAGSAAYTPTQLRSPEFTREHGLSASIMDDVLFNSLARPGDRERGVAMVHTVVGPADKLAITYLYGPIPPETDEEEYLNAVVEEHFGDPLYRFRQVSVPAYSDPSGQFSDLSSDPVETMYNRLELLSYVVPHVTEWLAPEEVSKQYKSKLPGYIFSEAYYNAIKPLLAYVGGTYINGVDPKSGKPEYRAVPADVQRSYLLAFFDGWDRLGFLDENRELMEYSGIGESMRGWAVSLGVPTKDLFLRLQNMSFSIACADEEAYTQEDMMEDMESYLFREWSRGEDAPDYKLHMIEQYVEGLIGLSPKLRNLYIESASRRPRALALTTSVEEVSPETRQATALISVPYFEPDDLTLPALRSLRRTEKIMKRARPRVSSAQRAEIDYNLHMLQRLLTSL